MRARLFLYSLLIPSIALSIGACVDRNDPTDPAAAPKAPEAPAATSGYTVAVQLPVASVEVGSVVSAVATSKNAAGEATPDASIQWLSSDNSVVGVNSGGQVTARKLGTAWVYATTHGASGRFSLTVTDSVPTQLAVAPQNPIVAIGGHLQLTTVLKTATGRVLSQRPISWTSEDGRYATVSASGVVTAVKAGSVRILAHAGRAADSVTVGVANSTTQTPAKPPAPAAPPKPPVPPAPTAPPAAPPVSFVPHEPASMQPIHDWDGRSLGSWISTTTPNEKFVFDQGLQSTVMEFEYKPTVVATHSTYGPGHLYYPIPAPHPLHTIYLRAQLKLSANWVQNPSNVLKVFEVFSGRTWAIPGIYGMGTKLRLMVANDEPTDPNYPGCFIGQRAPDCKTVTTPPDLFTLNQWHTIEVMLVSNTPGVSNGRVVTWLDGRLQTDVSNVQWAPAGTTNPFSQFDLNPLWGGLGGTIPASQFLSVGQIHLSGTPDYFTGPAQ